MATKPSLQDSIENGVVLHNEMFELNNDAITIIVIFTAEYGIIVNIAVHHLIDYDLCPHYGTYKLDEDLRLVWAMGDDLCNDKIVDKALEVTLVELSTI